MSAERLESLGSMLEAAMGLPAAQSLEPDPALRRVHFDWMEAGERTQRTIAILDQFRATLLAHRELWTSEPKPTRASLSRLTPTELALYDDIRSDRLAPCLRLEQERIAFGWLEKALGSGS